LGLPREPASASVQTRGFRLGSLVAVVVLATALLAVGLATRDRAQPVAEPKALRMSPSVGPSSFALPRVAAPRTFDDRGTFFHYPASWRPAPAADGSRLLPEGSSWSVVFQDDTGDRIAVAAYPSGDPGTPLARTKVANRIGRAMAGPPSSKVTVVPATYPSFGYPLRPPSDSTDALASGVGYVVFAPRTRYAIGCWSAASASATGTRCNYVLESFRETGSELPPATPTIQSVADAVYEAWKSGDPSAARAVATADALRSLANSPWTPETVAPTCDPVPRTPDAFSCTVREGGTAGKLFVVRPVRGRFTVVGIGDCSVQLTHSTCYILRSIGGPFP
jgi:hypothetical protein